MPVHKTVNDREMAKRQKWNIMNMKLICLVATWT